MGAADKAKEIVQDLTGMWWPEGDEDELREAARAWRTFADDVEDCTAACHKKAQDVIDNNKGQSIDAFETFWRKYHGGGKGYLDDLATAARDMAKALDKFADQIAEAKRKIEHELEIAGAVLVAARRWLCSPAESAKLRQPAQPRRSSPQPARRASPFRPPSPRSPERSWPPPPSAASKPSP